MLLESIVTLFYTELLAYHLGFILIRATHKILFQNISDANFTYYPPPPAAVGGL